MMFEAFPYAIAAFDADEDGDLDCAMVVKQELDLNSKTAVYVMVLPPLFGKSGENHTYNVREGASPDQPIFTLDDDADGEKTINYIYTNYENCAVADFPFKNKRKCSLWVKKDALQNTPQECMDQFEDNCDNAVARFDEETCNGFFDNV
ncbi:hypothetical protein HPB50_024042 [Hyalomma asiaticum]|uniref:Uncharacterized protein n=1 Tax=Hyalomma asiaticum TaxID=266040 RepID=A0ACB7T1B5_HYAAI|nr:hypothetical protein HPB50_024042 [Hyalomma asiaticum]